MEAGFWTSPDEKQRIWRDEVEDVQNALEVTIMQGGAAAYFNGHDHDLQHTNVSRVVDVNCSGVTTQKRRLLHHFTSGAGSKTGRGFGTSETEFEYDGAGFASVRVSHDRMKVQFWGPALKGAEGLLYTVVINPILGC